MFVRADLLLEQGELGTRGRQVIHYGWEDFDPVLLAYDRKEGSTKRLDLEQVDWSLSEGKWCVGSFQEDGYRRCPEARKVAKFDQCQDCASSWIAVQSCIFEPQCPGDRCESKVCRKEHTVYIAFFGEKAKIGMTTSRRLRERGIEQGADAIAPLVRRANRLEGRCAEKEIAKALRLPQLMQKRQVLEAQRHAVRTEALSELYQAYLRTITTKMGSLEAPLELLEDYPLGDLEGRTPELVGTAGRHRGRTIGLKGKFLFYEDSNQVKALELADLPGRYLSAPAGKRF